MPLKAIDFVREFDSGEYVEPFTFQVHDTTLTQ